jgi:hypothetical protein
VAWVFAASNFFNAMRSEVRDWTGLVVYLVDGRVKMTNVFECAIRPKMAQ